MAKEFKQWDNSFTAKQITEVRQTWLRNGASNRDIQACDRWPFEVSSWTQEQIRIAVYEAEGAADWQLFRVSMKGLTTLEKLYMCWNRWDMYNSHHRSMLEKCRIDNYILALKRGGLLNDKLEIVR